MNARFEFGTGDFKEWLESNGEITDIELVGTILSDKIKETSDMIMNSGINSIALSECEMISSFGEDKSECNETSCDYHAEDFVERKGVVLPVLLKMFLNKRYATRFVIDDGIVLSEDRKVIVHQPDAETIKVPDGVEIIGRWAYANYNMSDIILPDGLKEFGDYCMELLDNLHELKMPDSVVKLGSYSFNNSDLESMKLSDGIEVFPPFCLQFCAIDNLPQSLRVIEDENCFRLSGQERNAVLDLPYGFESIGSDSINGYDYSKVIFPSTTKFIAPDFWYDSIIGDDGYKPQIVISEDNPYFAVSKKNNIIYKWVKDDDVQMDFSRRAINFVESETERKYLLDRNLMLKPIEMIHLVAMSPEKDNLIRLWFFKALFNTTILTEHVRCKLKSEIDYCEEVWYKLHFVDKHKKFVAYGVTFNCVDEKTGEAIESKEERIGGIYDNSMLCMHDLEKMKVFDKYDKVVCRQYVYKAKKLGEEVGFFELYDNYQAINNVSYQVEDIDRPYIDLPYPFEPGDIVKSPHYDRQYVVAEIYRPTADEIKSGRVDSYDMAVTVLPVEFAGKVRECVSQGKPIPEKLLEEHDHLSFLKMEMVEKFEK